MPYNNFMPNPYQPPNEENEQLAPPPWPDLLGLMLLLACALLIIIGGGVILGTRATSFGIAMMAVGAAYGLIYAFHRHRQRMKSLD